MNRDEHNFGVLELNNLRSIANELEHYTCQHVMRYIFQESMEVERYPQTYRERFDIAFSQAVIHLIAFLFNTDTFFFSVNLSHIFYLRSSVVGEN